MRRQTSEQGGLKLLGLDGHGLGLVGERLDHGADEGGDEALCRLAALLDNGAKAAKGARAGIRLLLILVGELRLELGEDGALEGCLRAVTGQGWNTNAEAYVP